MKKRMIPAGLLAAAILLLAGAALAAEAPDLTGACAFRLCSTKWNESLMTDGKYTSYWESNKIRNPWISISSETPMHGLYLCWRQMPESCL